MLTQERLKCLLNYDELTGMFTWKICKSKSTPAGTTAGCKEKRGHVKIMIDGKNYKAHRLAWLYIYGHFPDSGIDHINEDPNDNRIVNLRIATSKENSQNITSPRSDNKSGYRGVYYAERNKWRASIRINGKLKHLGYFDTPEKAYEAYLDAKRKYHPFWTEK